MGGKGNAGDCGPDCPMHPNPTAWKTDDTMRVTHHYNQKEIMTAWKLYGIMSSSLLLIGLVVTGLGISDDIHLIILLNIFVQP